MKQLRDALRPERRQCKMWSGTEPSAPRKCQKFRGRDEKQRWTAGVHEVHRPSGAFCSVEGDLPVSGSERRGAGSILGGESSRGGSSGAEVSKEEFLTLDSFWAEAGRRAGDTSVENHLQVPVP